MVVDLLIARFLPLESIDLFELHIVVFFKNGFIGFLFYPVSSIRPKAMVILLFDGLVKSASITLLTVFKGWEFLCSTGISCGIEPSFLRLGTVE